MTEASFGTDELLTAVAGADRILDAGCGSARLTFALAEAGAAVTGIDTSAARLEQARLRAAGRGIDLRLLEADFNQELPFDDASFDAVVNRLSLMAAADPVATLRELRRVLVTGGRVATALWAVPAENPWFCVPREAVATVLGSERGTFARAFGKLGDRDAAAEVHRAASLQGVDSRHLRGQVVAASAEEHWARLAREIGHFARIDSELTAEERASLLTRLEAELERFRQGEQLKLPRALILVTARR